MHTSESSASAPQVSGAKSHVLDPRPGHSSQVTSSWHPALGEDSLARACKSFIGRGRDGDEIAVDGEVERDRCGQIGRCEPLRNPSRAEWETVTAGLTSARDRQPALIGRPGREPAVRARYRTGQAGLHSVTVLAGTHAWVLKVLALLPMGPLLLPAVTCTGTLGTIGVIVGDLARRVLHAARCAFAVACSTGTPCARGHVRACLQPLDRHHVGDGHFRPARVSAASRMQHCGRCTAEGCAALCCAALRCRILIRCIQVVAHCIWTDAFAACGGCVAAQPQVALRVASVC